MFSPVRAVPVIRVSANRTLGQYRGSDAARQGQQSYLHQTGGRHEMRADNGACLTIGKGMVFYCRLIPVLIECSRVFPSIVMMSHLREPSDVRLPDTHNFYFRGCWGMLGG